VNKRFHIYLAIAGFVFFHTKLPAFNNDSTKVINPPKHYFTRTIYLDLYSTGLRKLDTLNVLSSKLHSYQVSQAVLGFNVPVVTKDFYNRDSTKISNLHFLLTGNYASVSVNFSGISRHTLSKASLGFRGIYNNGKKSIFFIEVSPFLTKDAGYRYTRTSRLSATALYDCALSPNFSFRVGFTRSFLWGNRFHLPYIGIRLGRLDKVNFSVQFPRSVTFNVPIGKYVRTSLFTRPQGGLYTFANVDSLPLQDVNNSKRIYFGRYEFLSGLRVDILPSRHFNFYLGGGFTTRNKISLFSTQQSAGTLTSYDDAYREKIGSSVFLNVGLVVRFGKTRSVYNNRQLYDAMDLNNTIDPGDNGVNPGNGTIPAPAKKIRHLDNNEVLDLIETQDLY